MIGKAISLLAIMALPHALFAQDSTSVENTMPVKAMVIPFQPKYYFSDADHQLAEHNEKDIDEISTMFRYGLDMNVNAQIVMESEYSTEQLLLSDHEDAKEDLRQIYYGLKYTYEKPFLFKPKIDDTEETDLEEKVRDWVNKSQGQNAGDENTNMGSLKPGDADKKYMNVEIYNPQMLKYLEQKYGTQLFVFINQMELRTNYTHCLDRATNNFRREIVVHFSIYDSDAKQLYGNSVTFLTDSNTRDMDQIMQEFIPKICNFIAEQVPKNTKEHDLAEEGIQQ